MSEECAFAPQGVRQSCLIPIHLIVPNPDQPRKVFDESKLMELASSIRQYGLLQPVTVCDRQGVFQLVMGERRLRACKILGLSHIDAFVLSPDGMESALLALVENLQRENLHFLEEAESYAALLQSGMTQEMLGRRLGKSASCIANKVRLLSLEDEVRQVILEENLTERHARTLLRLPAGPVRLRAAHQTGDRKLTVRETEELVRREMQRLPEPKKGRKVISLARDPRLYVNAIRAVVEQMRISGVTAEMKVDRKQHALEVTVTLPWEM